MMDTTKFHGQINVLTSCFLCFEKNPSIFHVTQCSKRFNQAPIIYPMNLVHLPNYAIITRCN